MVSRFLEGPGYGANPPAHEACANGVGQKEFDDRPVVRAANWQSETPSANRCRKLDTPGVESTAAWFKGEKNPGMDDLRLTFASVSSAFRGERTSKA